MVDERVQLKPVSRSEIHRNIRKMLIHERPLQQASMISAAIRMGSSNIVNAVLTLGDRPTDNELIPDELLNTDCVGAVLEVIQALNALEDKIADQTFDPIPEDTNYWDHEEDLHSHQQDVLIILDSFTALSSEQKRFFALGDRVEDSDEVRVRRIAEIHNFRRRVLGYLLSSACALPAQIN